jgi:hypothetical protein
MDGFCTLLTSRDRGEMSRYVQRIGGYQQYGAANATVRLAAQSKRRSDA